MYIHGRCWNVAAAAMVSVEIRKTATQKIETALEQIYTILHAREPA